MTTNETNPEEDLNEEDLDQEVFTLLQIIKKPFDQGYSDLYRRVLKDGTISDSILILKKSFIPPEDNIGQTQIMITIQDVTE